MHAVDRGPAPAGLAAIRKKLTPKWVAYYRHGRGRKPTDSEWRRFQPDVNGAFSSLCGYCEESCKGDVDHFRPKSRFPDKVYSWDNWILACPTCNNAKINKWPRGGYVDPCAKTPSHQPESFLDFDTKTGEVIPRRGLTPEKHRKARQTIDDLKLDAHHHLKSRIHQVQVLSLALKGCSPDDLRARALARLFASRDSPLSSVSRVWLAENGFDSGLA